MIDVVAGIILNKRNQVMIARRSMHKHLGGKWEFPGGKVERNETLELALERELHEEFDISTSTQNEFITIQSEDSNSNFRLIALFSKILKGIPKLIEHEKIEWVNIESLLDYDLAGADIIIAKALIRRLEK